MDLLEFAGRRQADWIEREAEKPKIPGVTTTKNVVFPAESDEKCAICMDKIKTAGKLSCGHVFDRSCIKRWVRVSAVCPVCRKMVYKSK